MYHRRAERLADHVLDRLEAAEFDLFRRVDEVDRIVFNAAFSPKGMKTLARRLRARLGALALAADRPVWSRSERRIVLRLARPGEVSLIQGGKPFRERAICFLEIAYQWRQTSGWRRDMCATGTLGRHAMARILERPGMSPDVTDAAAAAFLTRRVREVSRALSAGLLIMDPDREESRDEDGLSLPLGSGIVMCRFSHGEEPTFISVREGAIKARLHARTFCHAEILSTWQIEQCLDLRAVWEKALGARDHFGPAGAAGAAVIGQDMMDQEIGGQLHDGQSAGDLIDEDVEDAVMENASHLSFLEAIVIARRTVARYRARRAAAIEVSSADQPAGLRAGLRAGPRAGLRAGFGAGFGSGAVEGGAAGDPLTALGAGGEAAIEAAIEAARA